jgi:thiol-disulfide isomerase/thioredoxin
MKSSHLKARWLGTLIALVISAHSACAGTPAKGDAFPDLSTYGLEGQLPEMKGKVVLIDFFASWCGPCQESFPAMEKLYREYNAKGLVIVAVNLDKKLEDMKRFLKDHPVSFSIVRDSSYKLVGEIKIPTMPSSFLLDKTGRVFMVHRGFEGSKTEKQYADEIEALLKSSP